VPDTPLPPRSPSGALDLAGTALAGRYRLERLIASGGMAQVWEAVDEVLTRHVAVKLLHPHLSADDTFVERFRHEAVAAARLAHPSIVSIYDTCSDAGREAIVMELVRGTNLRQRLNERGALDPADAVAIAVQVADALEEAHRAGLVHRDIKPGNILLCDDGRVMVADFGIAKAAEATSDLTREGTMIGTAKYLAPEQVEGGPIDGRADVYALGVVLYEMLCGRPPFQGDSDAATALARLHTEPRRPRQLRPGISRRLEDVVLRAMARRPEDRFQRAADLRAALLACDVADRDLTMADVPVTAERDETPPGGTPRFRDTERRWLVPSVVVVLLALALGIAGVLLGSTDAGQGLFRRATGSNKTPAKTVPVAIAGATAFDPFGGGGEHDDERGLAVDHDPATAWTTERYNDRSFGRLKPGVGLFVTLDRSAPLRQLVVTSPTADWSAQIYVAGAPAPALAGWGKPVATKTHIPAGATTFDLRGTKGAAVLVWITDLGSTGGRSQAQLAEITVRS
jgi:serine/threonine-protein kinase